MYKQFYGLRDIPFSLAPDPKYLFRTESLLEVFANLQYGIESGKGIVVITGEVGTGKTTILRSMLQSLDRSVLAAYIFNPLLSTEEFFDLLGSEFRMRPQTSKSANLRLLGNVLMTRHAQGLRTVLVVDEAHLLPPHLLEEIRLLSNFETNRDKLVQIIMCGQPELHELLAQPELRQLKQRISLKCSIRPLSAGETADYILWRIRVAGAQKQNLFESEAIRMIHRFSGGIPRLVNNICDNALLTGFSEASPRITPAIIAEVVRVLDLVPFGPTLHQTSAELAAGVSGFNTQRMFSADDGNSERATKGASNVHPIRRESTSAGQRHAGTQTPARASFTIESEDQGDETEQVKFFQRVRVTRNA